MAYVERTETNVCTLFLKLNFRNDTEKVPSVSGVVHLVLYNGIQLQQCALREAPGV